MNLEELQKNLIDYQHRHHQYEPKKKNFDDKEKEKEKAFKTSEIECYGCGEIGHIKRNCKKKNETREISECSWKLDTFSKQYSIWHLGVGRSCCTLF